MTRTVGDFLLERLDLWGVTRLFGYPGHGINGIVTTLGWDRALAADRPVVIDVKADPNVIALPPHATLAQAKNLFMALAKGDSDRNAIIAQLYKQ